MRVVSLEYKGYGYYTMMVTTLGEVRVIIPKDMRVVSRLGLLSPRIYIPYMIDETLFY